MLTGIIIILLGSIIYGVYSGWIRIRKRTKIPVSVNYHFTRRVNISYRMEAKRISEH